MVLGRSVEGSAVMKQGEVGKWAVSMPDKDGGRSLGSPPLFCSLAFTPPEPSSGQQTSAEFLPTEVTLGDGG